MPQVWVVAVVASAVSPGGSEDEIDVVCFGVAEPGRGVFGNAGFDCLEHVGQVGQTAAINDSSGEVPAEGHRHEVKYLGAFDGHFEFCAGGVEVFDIFQGQQRLVFKRVFLDVT